MPDWNWVKPWQEVALQWVINFVNFDEESKCFENFLCFCFWDENWYIGGEKKLFISWGSPRMFLCGTRHNVMMIMYFFQPKPIDVQVISHHMQRYAVWFGGSMLASMVKNLRYFMCHFFNNFSIFSLNFTQFVTQKPLTRNTALVFADTVQCSVLWHNWYNFPLYYFNILFLLKFIDAI